MFQCVLVHSWSQEIRFLFKNSEANVSYPLFKLKFSDFSVELWGCSGSSGVSRILTLQEDGQIK